MKRKALIFDLDGTLVNSLPDIAAAMNRSLVKSGLPTFPVEAYREKVGNGVFKIAERSVGSRTDCFDRVLPITAWESVLPEADALILSLPGTAETFRVLGEKQLSLLPDGAAVINVGRGAIIDQAALERELRSGRLCAALDVFEEEPLPADHSLWSCPNLILTPHIAGNMTLPWTVQRIVELFLEDLDHFCAGRPLLRRVDLSLGY